MSHYLEHVLDPHAEIEAASTVLPDEGLLFIEVPDPDTGLKSVLGRFWCGWLQPQHLHFLNTKNLDRILREHAFEPLVWQRGEAHLPCEFMLGACMMVGRIAPPADLPWRKPTRIWARLWHDVVWTAAVPAIGAAYVADQVLAPLIRRPGWAGRYRVLAQRLPRAARGESAAVVSSHA